MPNRRLREFTPELRERWLRAVEEEERARPANSRGALRTFAAIEEQTFSGELRRAIIASGIHIQEVAERAQVPFDALNAFMGGDAPLDSEAINRIVQTVGGHLVAGA